MFWIEAIGRDAEGFYLETINAQAFRETLALQFLCQPLKLKLRKNYRERITTDCSQWTRTDARPFWKQLGIEASISKDGQVVFRLADGERHYIIPASVFIAGMMRPIQHIQKFLFKPQGLESFSTPLLDNEHPKVGTYLPIFSVFGRRTVPSGLLATYSWMHCFPSANAMWASVYLAACDGRLDIALPDARITMRVQSVKSDNFHLVTELCITKLEALEQPFEFAVNHPKRIFMHESAGIDWQSFQTTKFSIPSRGSEWRLSESEWQVISELFVGRNLKKFNLREIIDLILIKFGTGCPWRKLDFGALNFPVVQNTYFRFKKNGSWHAVERVLIESRADGLRAST